MLVLCNRRRDGARDARPGYRPGAGVPRHRPAGSDARARHPEGAPPGRRRPRGRRRRTAARGHYPGSPGGGGRGGQRRGLPGGVQHRPAGGPGRAACPCPRARRTFPYLAPWIARPDNMEGTTPRGVGPPDLGERRIDDELTDIRNDGPRTSNNGPRGKSGPSGNGRPGESAPAEAERETRPGGKGEPRSQVKIVIPADHSMVSLLGSGDELLHVIEREFNADIHVRGNEITATGTPAETALVSDLFNELLELLRKGTDLTADAVERTAAMLRAERGVRPADVLTVGILSARGRTIRPKTLNQKRYADAIDKHTIVFAIGPAGTGKTYLAMAKAVKALQAKQVNRIILTRPAVEAGERLGFLPGTLYEKIDPYLRPLY